MEEEKMRILKMLEEGKITAEEAAELLKAIDDNGGEEISSKTSQKNKFKWMKIKVYDIVNNRLKVNLAIPYSLVNLGMKIGGKFIPSEVTNAGINLEEILEALEKGETGKIIDVYDEEDGEHVEISLE
ncbi:hypothetical protein SAMN04244560_01557 [Thermoanaerobacter thermohydrosulfuricus]|uniref:YvlB/LiaX N-terminal domain-containing protein n=4 Tax=Thermoanaerobacter TaxID=1754 RepID=G2MTK7_9THEO|nr:MULTISPECIES: hypothetical protein [Thermoanaerobacter]AEX55357.1 hypothetical protein [Thermoanaerobacter ethanolicus JW 200]HHY79842.1 DUF2089 domain-containing protein [Thermoanaerobacter sp.]AEM79021.1 Protein of unknown function DUF2089 [Thermoanaerobacter wiegelii Rt8.B1]EGD51795.1 Protein of unknown function DUF2089 [Thermoanaerobacter ethanolicus JW 200]EMT38357.1 hypothetical protein TthWC1_2133 [Thermoanaerobacter thermohydrosulfuricus WC1]